MEFMNNKVVLEYAVERTENTTLEKRCTELKKK